jgi:hypothetical protein
MGFNSTFKGLMIFSWWGDHSAGEHSEFLVFLYDGKKFTRTTPF